MRSFQLRELVQAFAFCLLVLSVLACSSGPNSGTDPLTGDGTATTTTGTATGQGTDDGGDDDEGIVSFNGDIGTIDYDGIRLDIIPMKNAQYRERCWPYQAALASHGADFSDQAKLATKLNGAVMQYKPFRWYASGRVDTKGVNARITEIVTKAQAPSVAKLPTDLFVITAYHTEDDSTANRNKQVLLPGTVPDVSIPITIDGKTTAPDNNDSAAVLICSVGCFDSSAKMKVAGSNSMGGDALSLEQFQQLEERKLVDVAPEFKRGDVIKTPVLDYATTFPLGGMPMLSLSVASLTSWVMDRDAVEQPWVEIEHVNAAGAREKLTVTEKHPVMFFDGEHSGYAPAEAFAGLLRRTGHLALVTPTGLSWIQSVQTVLRTDTAINFSTDLKDGMPFTATAGAFTGTHDLQIGDANARRALETRVYGAEYSELAYIFSEGNGN